MRFAPGVSDERRGLGAGRAPMPFLSLLFWLNKSSSENDKPAIYLRLRIGDKRAELSTYQYVSLGHWNQAGQCVKGSFEEAQTINRQLAILKDGYPGTYPLASDCFRDHRAVQRQRILQTSRSAVPRQ
jgi:hypothetical protein